MCFFKSRTRTLLRATALCLSASLLLTACGQQNNNNDILSPILPEDSPASNATSGEKMPDPVTIVGGCGCRSNPPHRSHDPQ